MFFMPDDSTAQEKDQVNCFTCRGKLKAQEQEGLVENRLVSDMAVEHGVQRTDEA